MNDKTINLTTFLQELAKQTEIKSIDIEHGILAYLVYIKNNRSDGTYQYHKVHTKALLEFFSFIKLKETKDINNETIQQLKLFFKKRKNKNSTINKRLKELSYINNYLVKNKIIDKPNYDIELLKDDCERFEVLTEDNIQTINKYVYTLSNQEQLIYFLIRTTGVRRTELIRIKNSNIDMEEQSIYLSQTKNGKPRFIFFDYYIEKLIKRQLLTSDGTYLFFNNRTNKRLMPGCVNQLFVRITKKTGVHVSAHVLRHTFATELLENNVDLESIRLLLGHSNYNMLKKYIHVNNNKLKKITLDTIHNI